MSGKPFSIHEYCFFLALLCVTVALIFSYAAFTVDESDTGHTPPPVPTMTVSNNDAE